MIDTMCVTREPRRFSFFFFLRSSDKLYLPLWQRGGMLCPKGGQDPACGKPRQKKSAYTPTWSSGFEPNSGAKATGDLMAPLPRIGPSGVPEAKGGNNSSIQVSKYVNVVYKRSLKSRTGHAVY